nr:MAG: hypothetical protein [Chuviridae sp.]
MGEFLPEPYARVTSQSAGSSARGDVDIHTASESHNSRHLRPGNTAEIPAETHVPYLQGGSCQHHGCPGGRCPSWNSEPGCVLPDQTRCARPDSTFVHGAGVRVVVDGLSQPGRNCRPGVCLNALARNYQPGPQWDLSLPHVWMWGPTSSSLVRNHR